MTLRDFAAAWWRKTVAAGIGAALAYVATRMNFVITPESSTAAIVGLSAVAASMYGGLVNALERKVPKLGWLLGLALQPEYRKAATPDTPNLTRRAGDYR